MGYIPHGIHGTIVYLPNMMWLIFFVNLSKCTVRPMGRIRYDGFIASFVAMWHA